MKFSLYLCWRFATISRGWWFSFVGHSYENVTPDQGSQFRNRLNTSPEVCSGTASKELTKKPALDNLVKRTSNSQLIVRSGEDVDKSLREKQAQNQGSSITDQRLSPPGALSHLRRSPIMSTNIRARPQSEVITSPLSDRYREKRPTSQILLDQEISIDGNSNKNYKPREAKMPPDRNFTLSSQKLSSNYQRQQPTGEIISESQKSA